MLKRTFILIFILISSVLAQRNYDFGWHTESIDVSGLTRYFKIYIPREADKNSPLIFVLHAENKSMNNVFDNEAGGFAEWPNLADREKFILLIPNGTNPYNGNTDGNNQKWNDCRKDSNIERQLSLADDVGFIDQLIEFAKKNLDVDEKKIYAAGVSNGGMMVYRLAIELGDKLAGTAVFLANMPSESECKDPVSPIAIFIMNSTDDPIVPFNGGIIAGDRGEVMSAEQTLNFWVNLNYLNTQKRTNRYIEDSNSDDNSRIIKNEFNRPLDNPSVAFYVVTNSGHVVPSIKYSPPAELTSNLLGNQNRDIEGVIEAWKFLKKFSN